MTYAEILDIRDLLIIKEVRAPLTVNELNVLRDCNRVIRLVSRRLRRRRAASGASWRK